MGACTQVADLADRMPAELAERCSGDKLWTAVRLGPHTWQAWLRDGEVITAMVMPDGAVKMWEQGVDRMYREIVTERRVRDRLAVWFGRRRVDHVEAAGPDCWRARLVDGGLAYATVEEDGSITINEEVPVC